MDEERALKNSFSELAARAYDGSYYTYSRFLTLAEQDTLLGMTFPISVSLDGGYDGAERRIAVFGSEDDLGYAAEPPLAFIEIAPVSEKFAEPLTHRDHLGSVLGLGLDRSVTGDIQVCGSTAYAVCLDEIADFIIENLKKVRHTDVKCRRLDALPPITVKLPDESTVIAASERADAIVAAVFGLSRSESERFFAAGTVFADARLVTSPDACLRPGCTVSVRGKGKFIYTGISGGTRKGRLRLTVRIYT